MLGRAVYRRLSACQGWIVDTSQRRNDSASDYLDILTASREQLRRFLTQRKYDFVVNCAGVLKNFCDETDPRALRRAICVNALFPHELAALLPGSSIIHVSTDGVFSGNQNDPYLETDPPDCIDTYGRTKVLGECPAPNVLNIRCSVIGRAPEKGNGLVEWVLANPDGAELPGFDDQLWNGVTSEQFAELCRRIIESGEFSEIRGESRLHHFCPNAAISKYELLCFLAKAAGRKITIRRCRSGAPSHRVLGTICSGLKRIFPEHRDWESVIREMLLAEGRAIHSEA